MTALVQAEELEGTVGPFLLSSEFAKDDEEVTALCKRLAEALSDANGGAGEGRRVLLLRVCSWRGGAIVGMLRTDKPVACEPYGTL